MRICPTVIDGEINAIPSKSYAHRIAICNFLAGKEPTANCVGFTSNDIAVTEECLKKVKQGERVLDCGESGSTLRFLLPLMASIGGEYEFIGHGKLMERPNQELFSVLNAHGVSTFKGESIKIKGKLESGEYRIRGDISSQYVSGLLMALPTLKGDSKIILTTPLASSPYVDITMQVLKSYGVDIINEERGFYIKGNAQYKGDLLPEGDWSNSAFFLTLGAICGRVKVTGLNLDSFQGDKVIVDILKSAGAKVDCSGDSVTVQKDALKAFTFDADSCPDLVPIASVLGAYARGKTVIRNIQRLRIKESDRVQSTLAMLSAFNVKAECDKNDVIIYGGNVKAGKADSFNDHRIAMSSSVLALGVNGGESLITNAKAVNKSYPTFFSDLIKIGGKAYEV